MNKIIIAVFFSLLLISTVNAADSEVTWTNPEKYTDIRASEESRKRFRERTFKALDEHFATLAAKLPEGEILKIDVTNVDLSGDVLWLRTRNIRVIKEIYFPRMKFTYQLVDQDKNVISSAEINIKDMNFMMCCQLKYRNESFGYEKAMLDKWFNKTFKDTLVKTR